MSAADTPELQALEVLITCNRHRGTLLLDAEDLLALEQVVANAKAIGSKRPGVQLPGAAEASYGLTIAIQHLNSNPYNLTKNECIELLRQLRDGSQS